MKFWSLFAPRRADLPKAPAAQACPAQEGGRTLPGVYCRLHSIVCVYCRLHYIGGLEEECHFCNKLLNTFGDGLRCVVVLKIADRIYTQGNIPLLEEDEENNFKAIWPLWWYVQDQFFTLMAEKRGVEKFLFVDADLKNELSKIPQFIDIVDLFSLASIKPAGKS